MFNRRFCDVCFVMFFYAALRTHLSTFYVIKRFIALNHIRNPTERETQRFVISVLLYNI